MTDARYSTDSWTLAAPAGTYDRVRFDDGTEVSFFPAVTMAAEGQIVITVSSGGVPIPAGTPRLVGVQDAEPADTLSVAQAQQMLDEAKGEVDQAARKRAIARQVADARKAALRQVDMDVVPRKPAAARTVTRQIDIEEPQNA